MHSFRAKIPIKLRKLNQARLDRYLGEGALCGGLSARMGWAGRVYRWDGARSLFNPWICSCVKVNDFTLNLKANFSSLGDSGGGYVTEGENSRWNVVAIASYGDS